MFPNSVKLINMVGFIKNICIFASVRCWIIVICIGLSLLVACDKKQEQVPAYISISGIDLKALTNQGNNIHDLSGVYVFVNNDFIGLFEFPCKIPILKTGAARVQIQPAYRLNGATNQLSRYTVAQLIDTPVTLVAAQNINLGQLQFKFRSGVQFDWLEDFEDNSSTFTTISKEKGDTAKIVNENFDLNGKFLGNTNCLLIDMKSSDTAKYFDLQSFSKFSNWPNDGRDLVLEFDLKSNLPMQLALNRDSEYVPYLLTYSTNNKWKRFYVNLVYEVGGKPLTTQYRALFSFSKLAGDNTAYNIYIDNVRLSYIPL